jgi:D-3-phosphoglycerate dehydrogenase
VVESSGRLHRGVWTKSAAGFHEIRGKRLGIIGYGNIGAQLSILAESLGMEVGYHDLEEKLPLGNTRKYPFKELLRRSDIITVHVDGRDENRNLIGEKEFAAMKEGVVFLNLSRGETAGSGGLPLTFFPRNQQATRPRSPPPFRDCPT